MTTTQVASIVGAVLAVALGIGGIVMGWFGAPDGLGLAMIGLSILGVHYNLPTSA